MLVHTVLLAASSFSTRAFAKQAVPRSFRSRGPVSSRQTTNKTWTQVDMYQGQSFLNEWNFDTFPNGDPTHGYVNYLDQADAVSKNLATVNGNTLTLAVDDFTQLSPGQNRDSVRISSQKTYNSGLFIADFAAMPAACGAWPAWWSVGPNWPSAGEIDVLEGVDATGTNQMTLHTDAGCTIDPAQQTGKAGSTNCISGVDGQNVGCGVTDPDTTSYGTGFNQAQGGVFAHEWIPESGIRIWHFQRSSIPPDITSGAPNPDSWGTPAGSFPAGPNCDFTQHFTNHTLTIDTTICGDWAGATYNSSGCPGTCAEIVANATNFATAKWQINYIAVYD
ncbi:glycoside hydrolase family 16 protein [Mycena maculata]|uniref:Glycoside hydrolase family 16 protein n=1 Tax=Mycena maculata TaxID=230809 RepID=A0AAD7HIK7_9AGAR|nr:glycoside hydrolase family 16 protein [Mycena maculata]